MKIIKVDIDIFFQRKFNRRQLKIFFEDGTQKIIKYNVKKKDFPYCYFLINYYKGDLGTYINDNNIINLCKLCEEDFEKKTNLFLKL